MYIRFLVLCNDTVDVQIVNEYVARVYLFNLVSQQCARSEGLYC